MTSISRKGDQAFERLSTDLHFFCHEVLRIKLKGGGEGPFIFNKAQEYLHSRIEKQLERTGMVRMFILKGRQQGISTYIAARYYWKATRNKGIRVFILSHHSSTTGTLFQIVDRYHAGCPNAVKPSQVLSNNRQMVFDNGSQYTVGTAGTGSIDRGNTNQLMHWSEVAYSENVTELLTGVCQTVGDVAGTEKLYESTAHGIGDFFHRGCMAAMDGEAIAAESPGERSDLPYELVFIPWYWNSEYRCTPREPFRCDEYERDLQEMYGLDNYQIQWRRNKIAEFELEGFGLKKFQQEYPFSIHEAFISSGDSLIDPVSIDKACKSKITDQNAPLIVSVDPARDGDRTVICWRRGRHFEKMLVLSQMNEMLLAGKLANIITKDRPDKVFVDITGACGNGAVDRLRELGFQNDVMGVQFSSRPSDSRYLNKRAEMAGLLKDWFKDEGGCRIPDNQDMTVELAMMPAFIETSKGLLQLESKANIKKLYGKSPDIFDAMMLSFAHPVRKNDMPQNTKVRTNSYQLEANRRRVGKKPLPQNDEPGWTRVNTPFRR